MEKAQSKIAKIVKRTALSLLFGVVFFFGYVFAVMLIYINLIDGTSADTDSFDFIDLIGLPVSFGYFIYKILGGTDTADYVERNTVLFFSTISSLPIIFWTSIFYLLLSLISKYREPKPKLSPPLPPERFE